MAKHRNKKLTMILKECNPVSAEKTELCLSSDSQDLTVNESHILAFIKSEL